MIEKEDHPLWRMRDAKVAHDCLSRSGYSVHEVRLCPCCAKHGIDACPHRGHEPIGLCEAYVLDESDVHATERRVHDAILRTVST